MYRIYHRDLPRSGAQIRGLQNLEKFQKVLILFVRSRRCDELDVERERARREKACASKMRYATRADALDAIAACEEHGRRGLSTYRCPYCGGWHRTSHPWK